MIVEGPFRRQESSSPLGSEDPGTTISSETTPDAGEPTSTSTSMSLTSDTISPETTPTLNPTTPAVPSNTLASISVPGSANPSPTTQQSSARHNTNTGAIAGGVVGGLIFVVLLVGCWLFWRRRKQKHHVAPSAEFTQYARTHGRFTPSMSGPPGGPTSTTPFMDVQSDDEQTSDSDAPPAFTKGNFKDPVYEKLTAAAAQREEVLARIGGFDPQSHQDNRTTSPSSHDHGEPPLSPLGGSSSHAV